MCSSDLVNRVLHVMPENDIECHLCAAGFGEVYESYLSHQTRQRVRSSPTDPEYWPEVVAAIKKSLVKPKAALQVIDLIHSGTIPVPPLLENVVKESIILSGGL